MKSCDEMVNSLFERRNQYTVEQRRKRKVLARTVTSMCCVCFIALIGFGMWQGKMFTITMDDSINIGEKDYIDQSEANQDEPTHTICDDSSNKTNNFCDMLGMVIIDNTTYIQFISDTESYTPDICLGLAIDFEGTYKTHLTDISGKLYTVKESKDILLVKLGNGGVVTLIKEKE